MDAKIGHQPTKPKPEPCLKAYYILRNAHNSASAFLHIFDRDRKDRNAQGAPKDKEHDLLRAMLIFATSGLDSMIKQLIEDALPLVIDYSADSHAKFKEYVENKLGKKDDRFNSGLLAEILVANDPRKNLIRMLVEDLTSQSLQSTSQLIKAGAYFGIGQNDIVSDKRKLDAIFNARNEIVHEMDILFNQINRSRRPRSKATMIEHTNNVFLTANIFLRTVGQKLEKN